MSGKGCFVGSLLIQGGWLEAACVVTGMRVNRVLEFVCGQ